MSPILTPEERLQAVHFLVPRLGQDINSWSAKAIPRAMTALLPVLDPSQASEIMRALPPAIAMEAVPNSDQDSAYLLTLTQVVETLARTGDPAAVEAFGQALAAKLRKRNKPVHRGALARAALPSSSAAIVMMRSRSSPTVAAATLVRGGDARANPTLRTGPRWQMPKARCDELWLHRTMRTGRGSPTRRCGSCTQA